MRREREGILVKPEELKAYGEALNGRIGELEQAIHSAAGSGFELCKPSVFQYILDNRIVCGQLLKHLRRCRVPRLGLF